MDKYYMIFYLDNGDEVSTPEFKAVSYQAVFDVYYKANEKTGMINIELGTESIFIPMNKICRMKVINATAREAQAIKNHF